MSVSRNEHLHKRVSWGPPWDTKNLHFLKIEQQYPLTSDDDDGRWDNKWWPLKGSADNSWMFQGEFREREKGQTPDVIDRGKTDDDDDLWMNDDDDDSK